MKWNDDDDDDEKLCHLPDVNTSMSCYKSRMN